jgi:ATP-binding cassette subfamily B protein
MMPEHLLHRARGGLLLRLTGDLSMVRMWLSRGQLQGASAAIVLAAGLAGAFLLDWVMASALVASLSVGAVLSLANGRAMRSATRTMRRRRSLVIGNIDEQINALAVTQVAGRIAGERARLSRQNDSLNRSLKRVAGLRGRLRGLSTGTSMVATSAVVATGVVRARTGAVLPETVLLEVLVARFLTRPVRTLGLMHDYWHRGLVSRQKILDFLASSGRAEEEEQLPPLRVRRGRVTFEHVSVPGLLDDFSAVAEPGTVVAITGGPGSGGPALLRLLARMLEPEEGRVLVDDQELSQTRPSSIGRHVGMASPDLPLMRGTVSRNLTYGAREARPDEVQRVVLGLGLDRSLGRLGPAGVREWLVEGGQNVTFGDRQLVALGRALMGAPRIVLLDNPLSGMGPQTRLDARAMILRHRGTVLWCTDDPEDLVEADVVWTLSQDKGVEVVSGAEYRKSRWLDRTTEELRWPATPS